MIGANPSRAFVFAVVTFVASVAHAGGRAASVSDVDAMPIAVATPKLVDGYRNFLAAPLPRAFALAPASGAWSWATGAVAAEAAVSRCQGFTRARCLVYTVDNAVAWSPSPNADLAADETTDWGIAPTSTLRTTDFHSPTPLTIPGAAVITTAQLRSELSTGSPPVLIDVLDGIHDSIPSALWMPRGGFGGETQPAFVQLMSRITRGDKSRDIVVFCMSSYCWLSYNAVLRISGIGYTHVHWYRGGIAAWKVTGGPVARPKRVD